MNVQKWQLPLQTSTLIISFMVWVIISSLIPKIRIDIPLTDNEVATVTAIPVILGSILRVPLGFWTNRIGARKMFMICFIALLFPVYFLSIANSFLDLVIGGLFLGIGGATFSIGVTALPKYYKKEKHGFINGIYGVGNIGTAITAFLAPILSKSIGWTSTIQLFLILLAGFTILNFFAGDRNEPKVKTSLAEQIKGVYKNEKLWFLSLFYFITFGSFVAFTVYLPNFLVVNFKLDPVDAGFRTAGFIAVTTFLRPVGGWLSDRFNPFIILMFVFFGLSISGSLLSFSPTIELYTIGCLTIALCSGIGNGTLFKLVPLYFTKQAGVVNGIVAAMGGIGGFFPPIVLTIVFSLTGHYAIGFMALSEFSLASFVIVVWMYYQEKLNLESKIFESTVEGLMVTDRKGIIQKINPAFSRVTGYEPKEIIGQSANILRSGKHEGDFYKKMWETIETDGYWQGEIWNKRKNGELYKEWLSITGIKNEGDEVKFYVGIFNEIK